MIKKLREPAVRAVPFSSLAGALLSAVPALITAPVSYAAPVTATFSVSPTGDIPYKVTYFPGNNTTGVTVHNVVGDWSKTVQIGDPNTAYVVAHIEEVTTENGMARMFMHCAIASSSGETVADSDDARPSGCEAAGPKSWMHH